MKKILFLVVLLLSGDLLAQVQGKELKKPKTMPDFELADKRG